jgi:phenylalanyl-tRNA synthetase beta chain
VPPAETEAILSRLGFGVREEGEGLHVIVPSFRADVEREVDLIEEVARIFGLELIPPTLPSDMRVMGGLSDYQKAERAVTRTLADVGLSEVITYTFIPADFADRLRLADDDIRRETVSLANPLSQEQSVMRTLMLPSLLDIVAGNLSQRNRDVNIFELGRVYLPRQDEQLPEERRTIGGCLCGTLAGESWLGNEVGGGFFDAKGLVEALFATVKGSFEVRPASEPFLHPGRSADILCDGADAGYMGEVHPQVLAAYGIETAVTAFEVDQDALISSSAGIIQFEDLITYPASFQDIAVVVDSDIAAARVTAAVRDAGTELLRSVRVFDIYEGDQVGEGRRSIALRLEFRSPERTLTDEDVDEARRRILDTLAAELGAELRG